MDTVEGQIKKFFETSFAQLSMWRIEWNLPGNPGTIPGGDVGEVPGGSIGIRVGYSREVPGESMEVSVEVSMEVSVEVSVEVSWK